MGYLFPHKDIGKDAKPHAGQDYEPSPGESGYKPLINIHTNHTNLEGGGFYDPRRNISKTLTLDSEEDMRLARERRTRAIIIGTLVLLLLIVGLEVFLTTR